MGRRASPVLPGLILIALGAAFLVGNLFGIGASALLVGLGLAFALARFLSRVYGYAVPAGVLLGLGAYLILAQTGQLGSGSSGILFIMVGLGFLLVYLLGASPRRIWPLFPAAALIVFGALLAGLLEDAPVNQLGWIGLFWPVILVLTGAWLIVRSYLPVEIRRPIGAAGVVLIIVYGVLAIASTVASAARPALGDLGQGRFELPFPRSPYAETEILQETIAAGGTLRVTNPNGKTVVRSGSELRVVVTRNYWSLGQRPDVRLRREGDSVTLQAFESGPFALWNAAKVDFAVELPESAAVEIRSSSGDVDLSRVSGAIQIFTSSGDVSVADGNGQVQVQTISGDIRLANLTGETFVRSTSGSVQGTNVARSREIATVSGRITLAGAFVDRTSLQTVSGDVTLRFSPNSAVRVDVTTVSGDIRSNGLTLADRNESRRGLTGTMNRGENTVTIRTTSGDVRLEAGR